MPTPSGWRQMYLAAAFSAVACALPLATFGADAQSLYLQAISAQGTEGRIDLKGAQDLLQKAAAEGNTMAMQRLGDMYHDGDGGVPLDFAKAMEWYQKEAALDATHPGSGALGMVALSEMYANGRGVTADPVKSQEWFNKALDSGRAGAARGDLCAMTALAYCLATGHGEMKADPVNAWEWAIKASRTPNPWAYEIMASLYSKGIGVKKDDSAALNQLLQAAQMGISRDMLAVSSCFADGVGVKKDEAAALSWVQKAVDRGNGRAMAELGRYYHEGIGVQRSDTAARDLYQKAVDMGDPSALGYMGALLIGPGVNPRDSLTAANWFVKGDEAGDAYSKYQLANLLVYDDKVPHDVQRAVELLMSAANMGYPDAMAMMGELYRKRIFAGTPGQGGPRASSADALVWFRKAADAGSPMGMRDLGEVLSNQADGQNPYSTEDDDKPLMAQAFSWLQKAAAAGDTEAMVDVGDAYLNGKGPASSASTAIDWYKKAANAGNVRAMRSLGNIYKDNHVLASYPDAFSWYKKGVAAGDAASMAGLAEMYDRSMGVTEDNLEALRLYTKAMELGDGGGYRGIGQFLQDGQILKQNLPQSAAYYAKAAQLGDVRAMEALGRMFELGQGVEKNMDSAWYYFNMAKDRGSLSAVNWIFSHTSTTTGPSRNGGGDVRNLVPPQLPLIAPLPTTAPAAGLGSGPGPGRGRGN